MQVIRNWAILPMAIGIASPQPLRASEETPQPDGSVTIDILARPNTDDELDPRLVEECVRQEDAAQISREIVVCREIRQGDEHRYETSAEAERRYAEETAFRDAPATPDVDGPGIFKGPATVGSLCIPGLQKCPPPPALIVDVTALPQAPPGSDADRIARGLPPLGRDDAIIAEAELGLPPPFAPEEATGINRAGSAAPAAER